MISELYEHFINIFNWFDTVVGVVMIFSIIQCYSKGFSLSLISFMKWIFFNCDYNNNGTQTSTLGK